MIRNVYKEIIQELAISTSVVYSESIDISLVDKFSVQAIWEDIASFTAIISVQASNDGIVFSELTDSSVSISGTDSYIFNFPIVCFRYCRVKADIKTGSGNFIANINTKGGIS